MSQIACWVWPVLVSTISTRCCAERTSSLPDGRISNVPLRVVFLMSGELASNSPKKPPPASRRPNSRYLTVYPHGITTTPSSPSQTCWVTVLNRSPADAPLMNLASPFCTSGDRGWRIRKNGICISSVPIESMPSPANSAISAKISAGAVCFLSATAVPAIFSSLKSWLLCQRKPQMCRSPTPCRLRFCS